jgi:hypothetical protein
MHGLRTSDPEKDLRKALSERRRILKDVQKIHEACRIMLENNNLRQILEAFQVSAVSLEKLSRIDAVIRNAITGSSSSQDKDVIRELGEQMSLLKNALEEEKTLMEGLGKKKGEISEALQKTRTDIKMTKAYAENIPGRKRQKLNKKA